MKRVLVANDERNILDLLNNLIQTNQLDIEIITFDYNFDTSFDNITKINPDILITDTKMPRGDGFDLIRQLNDSEYNIKIIAVTGCGKYEQAQLALKLNVSDYILKPVCSKELLLSIKKASYNYISSTYSNNILSIVDTYSIVDTNSIIDTNSIVDSISIQNYSYEYSSKNCI